MKKRIWIPSLSALGLAVCYYTTAPEKLSYADSDHFNATQQHFFNRNAAEESSLLAML